MKREFKEIVEKSGETLEYIETKLEEMGGTLSEDAKTYANALQIYLNETGKKLKQAYKGMEGEAELKSHLLLMETRDKMEALKEDIDTFVTQITKNSSQELDMALLKAHLAKLESKTWWEAQEKEFLKHYDTSRTEAERLAQKAGRELNSLFVKLTEVF